MATANTAKHVPKRLAAQLATRQTTVCLRCQYRAIIAREGFVPSNSLIATRGYASETTVQKWRKRLWSRKPAEQQDKPAEEAEPEDDSYVPATTWDGLQRVGGKKNYEEFEKEHSWEEGFMLPTKLRSKDDILSAIHRALIEAFTLREAGLPVIVYTQLGDDRAIEASRRAIVSQKKNGSVKVEYPDEASREAVITALTTEPPEEEESRGESTEEATEQDLENSKGANSEEVERASHSVSEDSRVANAEVVERPSQVDEKDDDFFEPDEQSTNAIVKSEVVIQPEAALEDETTSHKDDALNTNSDAVAVKNRINIIFPDPAIKFAIIKRVMQLTGHRIPDPALQDINSAKALIRQLVKKPKPEKLAQRLAGNVELLNLPNVKLRERRWTPIDKDKEVGRWKIIEEQLRERGLPVTGHS